MCKDLKMHIKITVTDDKEQLSIANAIHEQLRGEPDYVNNNIVLNIDTDGEINLYVFKECMHVPTITI